MRCHLLLGISRGLVFSRRHGWYLAARIHLGSTSPSEAFWSLQKDCQPSLWPWAASGSGRLPSKLLCFRSGFLPRLPSEGACVGASRIRCGSVGTAGEVGGLPFAAPGCPSWFYLFLKGSPGTCAPQHNDEQEGIQKAAFHCKGRRRGGRGRCLATNCKQMKFFFFAIT